MTDSILTYLLTVLAAYVAQQGATWMSMFSWSRVVKAAGWPLAILRPFFATLQEQHEERLKLKQQA